VTSSRVHGVGGGDSGSSEHCQDAEGNLVRDEGAAGGHKWPLGGSGE
jgi:hypothetical protein